MAYPTAVNSQITDSITQANVKVIAESPATAMGDLYQSLAHSTGLLFENAVSAQQQQAIAAQAATNQGVIQIYSMDTVAGAVAAAKVAQSDVPDNMMSLLTALKAASAQPAPKAMAAAPGADAATPAGEDANADAAAPHAAEAATAGTDEGSAGSDMAAQIRAAVIFANDTVLGNNAAFIAGLHAAVDAMAHALDTIDRSAHEARVHMLQEAALAATLAAMLREPEKAKEYETVLQVIQRMG